nr:hypothetical protein [Angustibacter aerolatus]
MLVEAAGVRRGDRVLDVAAGTGNAALPAAEAGAAVTAVDLTPEPARDRPAGRERPRRRGRLAPGRRRGPRPAGRVVRRRAVVRRRDVRAAPPAGRRRAWCG